MRPSRNSPWPTTLVLTLSIANGAISSTAFGFQTIVYNGQLVRWQQDGPVAYRVHSRAFDLVDTSEFAEQDAKQVVLQAIGNAFSSWGAVQTSLQFQADGEVDVVESGNDGRNTLIFMTDEWQQQSFGDRYVIAVTVSTYKRRSGRIIDSDIHFNAQGYRWIARNLDRESQDAVYDAMDLQNIATHEIGHLSGMDHSSEDAFEPRPLLSNAAMYFASHAGDTARRLLNSDDSNGLNLLYGTPPSESPAIHGIDPAVASNTEYQFVLRIDGSGFTNTSMPRLYQPEYELDLLGVVEESGPDHLTASFDLAGLPAGAFDVIVSNSFNSEAKFAGALQVEADGAVTYEPATDRSGGGCGLVTPMSNDQEEMAINFSIALIALLLLATQRWRFNRFRR